MSVNRATTEHRAKSTDREVGYLVRVPLPALRRRAMSQIDLIGSRPRGYNQWYTHCGPYYQSKKPEHLHRRDDRSPNQGHAATRFHATIQEERERRRAHRSTFRLSRATASTHTPVYGGADTSESHAQRWLNKMVRAKPRTPVARPSCAQNVCPRRSTVSAPQHPALTHDTACYERRSMKQGRRSSRSDGRSRLLTRAAEPDPPPLPPPAIAIGRPPSAPVALKRSSRLPPRGGSSAPNLQSDGWTHPIRFGRGRTVPS